MASWKQAIDPEAATQADLIPQKAPMRTRGIDARAAHDRGLCRSWRQRLRRSQKHHPLTTQRPAAWESPQSPHGLYPAAVVVSRWLEAVFSRLSGVRSLLDHPAGRGPLGTGRCRWRATKKHRRESAARGTWPGLCSQRALIGCICPSRGCRACSLMTGPWIVRRSSLEDG